MGTTWSAKAVLPATVDLPALEAMVQRALDAVVREMSPWEPLSDLSRYNRAAAGSWVRLPEATLTVLRRAIEVAEASDGAFDPTLGALTDLWGFGPRPFSGAPPERDAVTALRQAGGWKRLTLDGEALFQPGGLKLDLNGIAKGFGVDQAADALGRAGVKSYLLEVGGELRGTGAKPDGQPWWVELERPPSANDAEKTVVALHDLSVATSGDYRRFFDHDGRRYFVARPNRARVPESAALTEREEEIVRQVARGHGNKLIAYELGLSTGTVASHLASAQRKLGVRNRLELIRLVRATRPPTDEG